MLRRSLIWLFVLPLLCAAAPAPRSNLLVSTEWLSQHLNDANLVILEVSRDQKVYDTGHIPGSRFVALGDLVITRDGVLNELPPVANLQALFEKVGVSNDSRVILVGDVSPLFATRAYFTLDYVGHGDQTALLDGGLPKWKAESRALDMNAPAAKQGKFMPHPRPEIVATKDAVKDMTKSGSAVLVDARPVADYTGGNAANAEVPRPGHIPGAVNMFWQQGQTSKDDMSLLSETQLRKMYEAAGVKSDKPVVTYCNTGMQASQSYFTLKYLGYDTKMYDGSFSEWSAAKETDVQK